jgi:hypothetical protein
LVQRHSILEPGDTASPHGRNERARAIRLRRRQYLRLLLKEHELPRQHADDLVRRAIDNDGLAQNSCGAAEAALPKVVRENHGAAAAGPIVGFGERAADERLHTEQRQELVRAVESLDLFRIAGAGHTGRIGVPERNRFEGLVMFAVGEVNGRRRSHFVLVDARRLVDQRNQAVGFRKRQRLDQNAVDDAEDRRGRANRDGHRRDADESEPWCSTQHARGVAKIL